MSTKQTAVVTTTAAVSALVIVHGWVRFSAFRWKSRLSKFRSNNHGYTTTDGKNLDTLLVICPTSGGGKAIMWNYNDCLQALLE
jgi:hypothetical protein